MMQRLMSDDIATKARGAEACPAKMDALLHAAVQWHAQSTRVAHPLAAAEDEADEAEAGAVGVDAAATLGMVSLEQL